LVIIIEEMTTFLGLLLNKKKKKEQRKNFMKVFLKPLCLLYQKYETYFIFVELFRLKQIQKMFQIIKYVNLC
jgi:hypothetical protein